jgi:biotin synthase
LSKHELQQGIQEVIGRPVNRYSIVTSGKSLAKKEVQIVAEAISEFNPSPLGFCVWLGTLKEAEFAILFNAGVTRYHHNLETARSHYSTLCSTHSYEERVETIRLAKNAGMSVCSGGIFGVGESEEQILELALALKQLDVDSIPINFLTPIKGTPLESYHFLTPLRCLKIIALFRYVLPDKEIIVCGGRIQSLKGLHPLIFYAGASGIMTGNYLTTAGQTLESDSNLLESLALPPRKVS